MKKQINESYTIKNGGIKGQNGQIMRIAYIDPAESEGTYEHKDVIKNAYRGVWLKNLKTWGWFLGNNPEQVYRTQIQPCLQYLESVSKSGGRETNQIIQIIDQLIAELQSTDASVTSMGQPGGNNAMESEEEVTSKLEGFKKQLISAVSSDDFKKLIEPIIKFKRAQGHQFSFANALLIWIQDPEARMVKSRPRWAAMNRTVKPDAPALWAWVPKGRTIKVDTDEVTRNFLTACGKRDVTELTPGEKEELSIRLKPTYASSFKIGPWFYDYRFTEQMEGKEDLVGDPNADVEWFDDSGDETDESKLYVEAMMNIIKKSGVHVSSVDDLGGARGVSKNGEINVLNGVKQNMGFLNTLVHEFAHEVLHQKYLQKQGQKWAQYFVGTSEGRGCVEQQAELTAWIVLKFLGYDMNTNINYVGIWGMSENNASKVFDSVASVANVIYSDLMKEVNSMNNGGEQATLEEGLGEIKQVTGRDVAEMLGCAEIYDKSSQLPMNQISENFDRFYNRICNPIIY